MVMRLLVHETLNFLCVSESRDPTDVIVFKNIQIWVKRVEIVLPVAVET